MTRNINRRCTYLLTYLLSWLRCRFVHIPWCSLSTRRYASTAWITRLSLSLANIQRSVHELDGRKSRDLSMNTTYFISYSIGKLHLSCIIRFRQINKKRTCKLKITFPTSARISEHRPTCSLKTRSGWGIMQQGSHGVVELHLPYRCCYLSNYTSVTGVNQITH